MSPREAVQFVLSPRKWFQPSLYLPRMCLLTLVRGMSWMELPSATSDCLGKWSQGCPCLLHFPQRCCKPGPMGISSPSRDRNGKVSVVTHWKAAFSSPFAVGANYSVHRGWSGFLGYCVGCAKVFGLAFTKSSPLLRSNQWIGMLARKDLAFETLDKPILEHLQSPSGWAVAA